MSPWFRRPTQAVAFPAASAAGPAEAPLPGNDFPGADDGPALRRCEGSVVISTKGFGCSDCKVPPSKLEETDGRDVANRRLFAPKQEQALDGALTRLVHLLRDGRSPFEAMRNYQDETEAGGGKVLFARKAEGWGGDRTRSSDAGGGTCRQATGRTFALVHPLEPGSCDRRMTTVKADPKRAAIGVGHTDNRGACDYDLDLSRRLADSVITALAASFGVDAKRLPAAGAGMVAPAASNDDEAGGSKSRRVELVEQT